MYVNSLFQESDRKASVVVILESSLNGRSKCYKTTSFPLTNGSMTSSTTISNEAELCQFQDKSFLTAADPHSNWRDGHWNVNVSIVLFWTCKFFGCEYSECFVGRFIIHCRRHVGFVQSMGIRGATKLNLVTPNNPAGWMDPHGTTTICTYLL